MQRKSSSWLLCVALSFLALLTGCASEMRPDATGSVQVTTVAQNLASSDVARVELAISGPGMTPLNATLEHSGSQWTGVIGNIPAGADRTFSAQAFDASGIAIYEGQATGVTIQSGQTAMVVLLLQQRTAPTPFENSAPRISGISASTYQVRANQTVTLSLSASDADGDVLTYAWTADGGAFGNASVASPTWTAPATPGNYSLSVVVSDGRDAQSGMTLRIAVLQDTGNANVAVSFNTWPAVTQVKGTPFGQVAPGGAVTLDVTATDADGDALTYAWSDDCGGGFSATTATHGIWTAPASEPTGGQCKVTVTVTDGRGGSTTGTLRLNVIHLQVPTLPPVIGQVFQSAAVARAGDTVRLFATATDPEGAALTFTWSASGGTLATPITTANRSEVVWTAPADSGGSDMSVTLAVEDASGQRTTQGFTVQMQLCVQAVTSYLLKTNASAVPLVVTYRMVGGGGGGAGRVPGAEGARVEGSFTWGAAATLEVIVGGGGGFGYWTAGGAGAGGAGYFGGGAGGTSAGGAGGGGGGGSSAILSGGQLVAFAAGGGGGGVGGGGGSNTGGAPAVDFYGHQPKAGTAGTGGSTIFVSGGAGLTGGAGGESHMGGGGGFGGGGGGAGPAAQSFGGSSGGNGGASSGGMGANTWSTVTTLPTEAGASTTGGGNAGLVILKYDGACAL
ncbi:EBNA-1 protein [Corallococcus coralloides DSM 2259]|uniref:EBNA-1 protein n=1 Tax=Corallococcus coralloides (strain ATCC 25202 / DSM 2259 / NBRC 100086 / M2) TaxID=1144275 RepID=H8MFM7_CORCM|nr:PKD domain-containing protein [Corallococcus coralloides]AFE06555.1 EBNA-1 protein [Corallococcus coralloides DSM 2259]